jgi:hypothetical protein
MQYSSVTNKSTRYTEAAYVDLTERPTGERSHNQNGQRPQLVSVSYVEVVRRWETDRAAMVNRRIAGRNSEGSMINLVGGVIGAALLLSICIGLILLQPKNGEFVKYIPTLALFGMIAFGIAGTWLWARVMNKPKTPR